MKVQTATIPKTHFIFTFGVYVRNEIPELTELLLWARLLYTLHDDIGIQ